MFVLYMVSFAALRPSPQLRFTTTVDPNDTVTKTFYRHIESFTAEDPKPLIEGRPYHVCMHSCE
jgi:hypothetical protein